MTATGRLPAVSLGILLAWGVLSLWVEQRWAWAVFEVGILALAGWRMVLGPPFRVPWATVPLAFAAVWPLLQLALGTTAYRAATASAALDWGVFLLVFVLASEVFGDPSARHRFLEAASLFGMCLAVVATIGKYACPGKAGCLFETGFEADVMGPFANRNQYCAWIELVLPASLYLAWAKPRLRVLYATAAAIMAGSVVASASRAGTFLIGAEIAVVAVALAVRHRLTRRKLAAGALQFAMLAAIAVGVAGWQEVWGRWHTSAPDLLRRDALRASIQMVEVRPWTGSGLGTWSRIYPQYAGIDQGVFMNQAHNDWAQWAAEGGLPFLLFLFFFAALSWKPAVRSIYGMGMVVFLVHAMVDYPMQQRPALAAWFFCVAGVAAAWQRSAKR